MNYARLGQLISYAKYNLAVAHQLRYDLNQRISNKIRKIEHEGLRGKKVSHKQAVGAAEHMVRSGKYAAYPPSPYMITDQVGIYADQYPGTPRIRSYYPGGELPEHRRHPFAEDIVEMGGRDSQLGEQLIKDFPRINPLREAGGMLSDLGDAVGFSRYADGPVGHQTFDYEPGMEPSAAWHTAKQQEHEAQAHKLHGNAQRMLANPFLGRGGPISPSHLGAGSGILSTAKRQALAGRKHGRAAGKFRAAGMFARGRAPAQYGHQATCGQCGQKWYIAGDGEGTNLSCPRCGVSAITYASQPSGQRKQLGARAGMGFKPASRQHFPPHMKKSRAAGAPVSMPHVHGHPGHLMGDTGSLHEEETLRGYARYADTPYGPRFIPTGSREVHRAHGAIPIGALDTTGSAGIWVQPTRGVTGTPRRSPGVTPPPARGRWGFNDTMGPGDSFHGPAPTPGARYALYDNGDGTYIATPVHYATPRLADYYPGGQVPPHAATRPLPRNFDPTIHNHPDMRSGERFLANLHNFNQSADLEFPPGPPEWVEDERRYDEEGRYAAYADPWGPADMHGDPSGNITGHSYDPHNDPRYDPDHPIRPTHGQPSYHDPNAGPRWDIDKPYARYDETMSPEALGQHLRLGMPAHVDTSQTASTQATQQERILAAHEASIRREAARRAHGDMRSAGEAAIAGYARYAAPKRKIAKIKPNVMTAQGMRAATQGMNLPAHASNAHLPPHRVKEHHHHGPTPKAVREHGGEIIQSGPDSWHVRTPRGLKRIAKPQMATGKINPHIMKGLAEYPKGLEFARGSIPARYDDGMGGMMDYAGRLGRLREMLCSMRRPTQYRAKKGNRQ